MVPLFDKAGELHHLRDAGTELILNNLKGQYKTERELYALLGFLDTLEKLRLM